MMTFEKREYTRDTLFNHVKLKTFDDLNENLSNLDDILDEYRKLASIAKELSQLRTQSLQEALTNHSNEFMFYRTAMVYLKRIVDYFENLLRYERGVESETIRNSRTRSSDLNDRAITQLIDGKHSILRRSGQLLKVKEVYEIYQGINDSYIQRGYSLNNITKAVQAAAIDMIL